MKVREERVVLFLHELSAAYPVAHEIYAGGKRGNIQRVAVISGTEGEYFPERFVTGRAKAFRLTAYERHDNLRPKCEEFVTPWEEEEKIVKK